MGVRWIEGTNGDAIGIDDTHFPVILSTWEGPASEAAVRAYFRWLHEMLERAKTSKLPLVNITETGRAENPNAAIRKLIAELTKVWGQHGADTHPVTAYVVVQNAVFRGVLTALGWLHGNMKSINVATLEQAQELAYRDLERAGLKRPTTSLTSIPRRRA